MKILDGLKDIVKHTNGLGFIEAVKIIGSSETARIEAIDPDKTVVVFGNMYQPISGLETTVGLSRIGILKGYLDYNVFANDASSVTVVSETRNNILVPSEVKFDSGSGHTANYRFMSEAMVNEQVKVPPFKGAVWNVSIEPEKKKIADLAYCNNVLGNFEKRFTVSTKNNELIFNVGSGPTDRMKIIFAEDINGSMQHQWSWPLAQVLSILKLSDTASKTTMQFSDMGAMKITTDSGLGIYEYILPAGKV